MSKMKLFLVSLIAVIGILGGCNSEGADNEQSNVANNQPESSESNASDNENQEKMVTISVTKKKGEETVTKKEVPIEDGAILMDVMKKNFDLKEDGGFITTIEGIEAKKSEKMAWMYSINGESASVGASDLELTPGDSVNFDLHSWE
ncbi:hypothetical protein CFK37_14670 [Virgibacillus phasianinus]|uniref:Transcobalamin-like C-terminal domain-containing protein n=1 Tax=Virgibacillus phasianinus TaxID=2017483 RepID=A0A220U5C6_9BACI|nr:DUF4430 domain-containing protein [Virgibacillus phasianinus]ASK63309.1 hypothetical protein CFK37_14670 [Virgibacillus phasianinus]